MTKAGPKRNPPAPERGASGPDVNQSGKQLERESDQGIRRDQRGQDQPKDKDPRAELGSLRLDFDTFSQPGHWVTTAVRLANSNA